jgi:hypothetical protein
VVYFTVLYLILRVVTEEIHAKPEVGSKVSFYSLYLFISVGRLHPKLYGALRYGDKGPT